MSGIDVRAQARAPGLAGRRGGGTIADGPRAVAVGFEPTNGFPRYTLSSSANQGSATVVGVRHVLNKPVRGCHRTRANDDE